MKCPHGYVDHCTPCQREWYRKARASGFIDLEGPTGDGNLSDRGNLHPVSETSDERARLAQRIDDGDAYTAWATSVLHDGPGFRTAEAKEVWRLHAEGLSEREIGTTLTIARRSVRRLLTETRNRVGKVGREKRWRDEKKQRRAQARTLVRRCDPQILVKLVAVMMRQQGLKLPSAS